MILLLIFSIVHGYDLNANTNFIYTCDYSSPIASTRVSGSAVPCSSLYTPVLNQVGINTTTTASVIWDIDSLSPVPAYRCFKLTLVTTCLSKWRTPNEISRYIQRHVVSRDECLTGSACVGCEIGNSYLPETCETYNFKPVDVKKVVIFKYSVTAQADRVGNYYFGTLISNNGRFDLGGDYNSFIFYDNVDITGYVSQTKLLLNPTTRSLISFETRRLMEWSGEEVKYNSQIWLVYSKNNYVLKSDIIRQSRLLQAVTPGIDPLQAYLTFFINAQLNVTNWRLQYLDCRVKSLILAISNRTAVLDLAVGEIYKDGFVNKYPCKTIGIGTIVGGGGCLRLDMNGDSFLIKPSGEVTNSTTCAQSLRINTTHVLNINTAGVITTNLYSYPSLQDDESVLKYPPNVVFDKTEILRLIRASNTFDVNRNTAVSIEKSSGGVVSLPSVSFFDGAWLKIVYFVALIINILFWGFTIFDSARSRLTNAMLSIAHSKINQVSELSM